MDVVAIVEAVRGACRDAREPVDEQTLLIALLTDEDSTARTMLRRLKVAPELVIQRLRAPSAQSQASAESGEAPDSLAVRPS
ncbi:hypothetical protein ACFWVU_35445 [Streptomyces sp. NPDC058686]|uniref:hypothetical protein n=1 Tax=Streptomyces sp. NPDC058686 TaxID=3346599 RepID=UPI00365BDF10